MIENVYYEERESLDEAVGKSLKYRELCELINEDAKQGNSKASQLKRIERYLGMDRPTTHTYVIREVYPTPLDEVDGRRGNGGARRDAGRKRALQKEFEHLLYAFIGLWRDRAWYNFDYSTDAVYFTTREASVYFGVIAEDAYDQYRSMQETARRFGDPSKKEERLEKLGETFRYVMAKARERTQSLIIAKMREVDALTLCHGIIAYKQGSLAKRPNAKNAEDRMDIAPERRDDLLEDYDRYEEEYLKMHGMRNLGEVIEADAWKEMTDYIASKFPDYEKVIKVWKLILPTREEANEDKDLLMYLFSAVDLDVADEYQLAINEYVVESLRDYFIGKFDDPSPYLKIVDWCVSIEGRQRNEDAAGFLEDNPEYAGELTGLLGFNKKALIAHIDWLGIAPEKMLEKAMSLPALPSKRNYRRVSKYGTYWKALKKALSGEKQKDYFVAQNDYAGSLAV